MLKAIKDIDKLFRSLKKLEKIDVSSMETVNKINGNNLIKIGQEIQALQKINYSPIILHKLKMEQMYI